MKLPNWLRTLMSSLTYGRVDPVPVVPTAPSPASEAHRVIREALDQYRMTHADDDQPRLHVSREAWEAITREYYLTVTDPSCTGPTKYEGRPVTVSYFEWRPGIWCDALRDVPRAARQVPTQRVRPGFPPMRGPGLKGDEYVNLRTGDPVRNAEGTIMREPSADERDILAEFNGVTLQQGAAAEEECEETETALEQYRRVVYDQETAQAVSEIDDNESEQDEEDEE